MFLAYLVARPYHRFRFKKSIFDQMAEFIEGFILRPVSGTILLRRDRNETDADVGAIAEVTIAAFKTLEISQQCIIAALRAAKALTLSLVAEVDGRVVGHIAFSPLTLSDGTRQWYGLGPVSVLPEYQQGIGLALIQEGLSRLEDLSAKGGCLVGHPQYYPRFGFRNPDGLVLEGVPQKVFFALSFDGDFPRAHVSFHEAFKANG